MPPRRYLGLTLVYGLLFLGFLYLGFFFHQTSGVSLWYPAAGLRLAALLVLGGRFAPGIVVAEVLAVSVYGLLQPNSGIGGLRGVVGASVTTLTYSLAAFVLTRYSALDIRLRRFRDVAWMAAAAMVIPLLGALTNRLSQIFTGRLAIEDLLSTLVSFWIGDSLGVLMLTPLLLVWSAHRTAPGPTQETGPTPAQLLFDFVLVVLFLVFAYRLPEWFEALGSNVHWYLAFLPLIWISFRHGLNGSLAGILALTSGAAWLTYLPAQSARFQELQIFVLFLALTCLLMGSVVTVMRTTERALSRQNRELLAARSELQGKNEELEGRNAELERFTYAVSHDLKTPLVTIRGFVGMLKRDVAAGAAERMHDDMRRIETATGRMSQLLDELLELARVGQVIGPREEIDLGALAAEVVEQIEGKIADGRAKIEISPRLPIVVGDRLRLSEVLQNLIDNAVRFTADQPTPRIEIGVRGEGDSAVFYVRDNGLGIDPRYHERIFGLFERLEAQGNEGTGIGLALVRRIVERHGGRVWAESEGPGHGSTFCFTLPWIGEDAAPVDVDVKPTTG